MPQPLYPPLRPVRLLLTACLAVAALAAGCMVGPDFKSPDTKLQDGYASLGYAGSQPTTGISITTAGEARVRGWWNAFNDPVLSRLVDDALAGNLSLIQAEARIRQARARRGQTEANLFPTVDLSGAYRRSGDGLTNSPDGDRNLYTAGFDASWEVDIFGAVRRGVEASEADLAGTVYDYFDVRLTLVSELAVNYFELRSAQQRLAIAIKNIELQQTTLSLTERLQAAGIGVTRLDVLNSQSQMVSTKSQIPQLEQTARAAAFTIALLLGREPQTMLPLLEQPDPIPTTPPEVPVGLPSELLRRRPDIRRAEARVHGATARIGVATADLFPRFSLTGSFGSSGDEPPHVFDWDSTSWAFGPTMRWNIFDASRIRSRIAEAEAAEEEALAGYRQSVLVALTDMEVSLTAYEAEQRRRIQLNDAVNINRRALDLAQQLFSIGQTNFLNLLVTQRELLQTEDSLVQSDRNTATNLVAIYKSLGGGWDPDDLPVIPAPPKLTASAELIPPATLPTSTGPAATGPATDPATEPVP